MPLTPKNRKEEWLQGLVDHETTLTPKNRPEEWIKEIIDASGGGGGAGIDLGITGASAGEYAKIKTVDADGVPTAWESGTGGGGVLVVHDDEGTLDKTWKEIHDASFAVVLYAESPAEITIMPIYSITKNPITGECGIHAAAGSAESDTITWYDYLYVAATENDYPAALGD